MKPEWIAFCLLVLSALGGSVRAADPLPSGPDVVVLRRCPIEYERTTHLGAAVTGVVQDCLVRLGDRVKAGQVLGRLQDEDVRAELALHTLEADSDVGVRASQARYAGALAKLRTAGALVNERAVGGEEYRLDRVDAETAALAVEEARHTREVARLRCRQSQALLHAREFVSPHDGVVAGILKAPGEAVVPGDPVFWVVQGDRMRVTGALDVTDLWRVQAGQPVRVSLELAGADLPVKHAVFTGRVVFVDGQVDPKTQTCKVIAEVDNRDALLRAGLEARLEIDAGRAEPALTARPTP